MMLKLLPSLVVSCLVSHPVLLHAQSMHSDVEFGYDANQIDVKVTDTTGARVGVGDFALDGLFRQFEENPGFASESDVGLGINPSDTIVYNVLDNLLFWNGAGFATPNPSTQVRIENNGAVPDTLVSSSSGSQSGGFDPPTNVIGQADGIGDFHSHVDYHLEPNIAPNPPPLPEIGAYGLKLSLATDAVGIADSDPFLIVFNFGLDSIGFENAVEQFAELLAPDLPGDFDRSGAVDGDDYLLWRQQFGSLSITPGSGADGNNDGVVNLGDYTVWRDHLGAATGLDVDRADSFEWQRQLASTGSPATRDSSSAVPEPSTLAIAASAICGGLLAGRRRLSGEFFRSR